MKFVKLAVASLALAATPALAQSGVTVGSTVYGPEGNQVGTIVSVENGQAVLDTGKHKVPLALNMYGEGENGPTITVTKMQIDTMVDQQLAQSAAARDAALVEGASVMDANNEPIGTILEINGDNVIIARGDDEMDKVTLLREYFDAGDQGLKARLTNAQIDAAMNGGAAAPAATAADAEANAEAAASDTDAL
ncbi:hypothetical protein E3U23_06050 [Erythrobacter litoralis]|uniref:hypothetical protein n=1 Tax=Erythrobacter litoralis TaxID=39960 RepID=UPI002435A815|nr:hypothetical protein [Erythrobacter litoralis]MDG6078754.1 hypothetical protein [Erythrobacter litoralis]